MVEESGSNYKAQALVFLNRVLICVENRRLKIALDEVCVPTTPKTGLTSFCNSLPRITLT